MSSIDCWFYVINLYISIYRDRGIAIHPDGEKWEDGDGESVEMQRPVHAWQTAEQEERERRAAAALGHEEKSGKKGKLISTVKDWLSRL